MSAYDEIIRINGDGNLATYRKQMMNPRGSMMSGSMPEVMKVSTRARNRTIEEGMAEGDAMRLAALYMKKLETSTRDYGFVFDKDGTEAVIHELIAGNPLAIDRKFANYFRFENERDAELWSEASDYAKRRLISKDLMQLKKKTDMQYRIHGNRLHYLVLGKVSAMMYETSKAQRVVFPLFLFECIDTDSKRNLVEVEQTGFVNFAVDEKYFTSEIRKANGGIQVDADDKLPTKMMEVKRRLEKLNLANLEDVEVDVTFSMIGVVTGFVAEYLDKVWDKIL